MYSVSSILNGMDLHPAKALPGGVFSFLQGSCHDFAHDQQCCMQYRLIQPQATKIGA